MFHLRITQKLQNVSRLKPGPDNETIDPVYEWYANLYPTSFRGKSVILFVNTYSKLSVLVKGKSLTKSVDVFKERLELLLIRNGIELEKRNRFMPEGDPMILKSKNKSILGFMNTFKQDLDYWFHEYVTYEDINLNRMEDLLANYMIPVRSSVYTKPIKLVRELK